MSVVKVLQRLRLPWCLPKRIMQFAILVFLEAQEKKFPRNFESKYDGYSIFASKLVLFRINVPT